MRLLIAVLVVGCHGTSAHHGDDDVDAATDTPAVDASPDAMPDTPPGCAWEAETIATVADPGRPVIAVTPDGDVHILFFDPTGCRTIHYATKPAGATAWTVTALDDHVGDSYQYFSLTSDAAGGLHTGFYEDTPGQGCAGGRGIYYGYKPEGGSWTRSLVAAPQTGGVESGIAVDGSDVHLVYDGSINQRTLEHAHRTGSAAWTVEAVPSTEVIGSFPNIRVDAAHRAHVSVMGETAGVGMVYAERSATGTWTTTTLDTVARGPSSIDVDAAGGVHVVYADQAQFVLHYAYRPPGGAWSTAVLDADHVMAHETIRVDSTGTLHVIYSGGSPFNGIPLKVRHAHAAIGGTWTTESIGTDEGVFGTSLALDAHDALHLAYARMNAGAWDVRYAHLVCH